MFLVPGAFVIHPQQPQWGIGQVQSVVGTRITVNFEHVGKIVIDSQHISLDLADLADDDKE
jgi:hypothetical protein